MFMFTKLMLIIVRNVPKDAASIAVYLNVPNFPELVRRFLYEQLHPEADIATIHLQDLPPIALNIHLYPSAIATFRAPSDCSGVQGMRRERI